MGTHGRRDGAKKLFVRTVERPDGTQLLTGRGDSAATDPNQIHATPGKRYGYGPVRNEYPIDITGAWRNRYKFRVTVDDLEPKPTPFTAEGRALFAATDHYQDPALRCLALGLPRLFGAPYDMEIVDAGTHYVLIHVEHNTPRRVWMDGRQAPPDTQPSSLGFSAGAVDTVGGDTLATLLRETKPYGVVAACGLVGGDQLPLTVHPFILRGVTLAGISSATLPLARRLEIWRKLSDLWRLDNLAAMATTIGLPQLEQYVQSILRGQIVGRTVVDVSATP
jgi:hypothetical protein